MKKHLPYLASALACSLVALTAAGHASVISQIRSWHPYVQVAYSPSWIDAKGSSSLQVAQSPNPADTFVLGSHKQMNDFAFGAGFDFPLSFNRSWLNRLDFDIDYTNMKSFAVNGVHTMTLLIPATEFKYDFNYRVKTSMLLFDANIDLFDWQKARFYAGAGVDLNWMKTFAYSEKPQAGTTLSSDVSFDEANKTQWLYHLNVGVKYDLTNHFRVGVSDRFYPHISTQTGTGTNGIAAISALKHHLSMNQVSVALDYLF